MKLIASQVAHHYRTSGAVRIQVFAALPIAVLALLSGAAGIVLGGSNPLSSLGQMFATIVVLPLTVLMIWAAFTRGPGWKPTQATVLVVGIPLVLALALDNDSWFDWVASACNLAAFIVIPLMSLHRQATIRLRGEVAA